MEVPARPANRKVHSHSHDVYMYHEMSHVMDSPASPASRRTQGSPVEYLQMKMMEVPEQVVLQTVFVQVIVKQWTYYQHYVTYSIMIHN